MKVVVEKNEALEVKFDINKEYLVLKDFSNSDVLGTATISVEKGIMYACLKLNKYVNGYPAIGYDTKGGGKNLFAIGISETRNQDESIEPIEYTLQLEGKPSNLKTK